jgi:hypothetical protein
VKLDVLAKTFIKKIELQTGYRLYWLAAEHYNTAHPHVHLLINGRDQNGKDVFFPRDVVKTFMRESARDVCTSLIGNRTTADMKREAQAAITANRFTPLDERMKEYVSEGRVYPEKARKDRERYIRRLDHLRNLGVCAWNGSAYVLQPDWEDTLKTIGKYNAFMHAKTQLAYTSEHNLTVYTSAMGTKTGRVTKIYQTDEVSDNHAVVVESIDGNAYFIPLFARPAVREGDTIRVIPEKNQRGRLRPSFKQADITAAYREAEQHGYHNPYAEAVRNQYHQSRASGKGEFEQ